MKTQFYEFGIGVRAFVVVHMGDKRSPHGSTDRWEGYGIQPWLDPRLLRGAGMVP